MTCIHTLTLAGIHTHSHSLHVHTRTGKECIDWMLRTIPGLNTRDQCLKVAQSLVAQNYVFAVGSNASNSNAGAVFQDKYVFYSFERQGVSERRGEGERRGE